MVARPPRRLVLALGGLVVLGVVALGVVYGLVQKEAARWPSLAETPRPTAHLAPIRGDRRVWERIEAAGANLPVTMPEFPAILESNGVPDENTLQAAQPFLGRIDALRSVVTDTTGLSIPQPESNNDAGPELLPILKLTRAWLLSAWSQAAAGDPARGVAEMLHVRALASRFIVGDTGLVGTMMGIVIHGAANRELLELLHTFGEAHPELYTQAAAELSPIAPGCVARAMVVEARMVESMFVTHDEPMSLIEAWGYDEDLTRVWYRTGMQRVIDQAERPRWERRPALRLSLWSADGGIVQQLHNRTGRILLQITTPDFERFVDREDVAVAGSRLDILVVAARRFALDHGGVMPASQTDLVPSYLPAALLDPHDGQPLRLHDGHAWSAGVSDAPERVQLRRVL